MSFEGILRGLGEAGVSYVLIGGLAGNAHGSARVTFDVDICYEPVDANRQRLAACLVRWHAYLRGVEPGLPWILDARALRDAPVLTLVTDEGNLDVMDRVAGIGDYERVRQSSEEAVILGISTRMITLDALIAAKRAAGRRKDTEALLELEALREIRKKKGL